MEAMSPLSPPERMTMRGEGKRLQPVLLRCRSQSYSLSSTSHSQSLPLLGHDQWQCRSQSCPHLKQLPCPCQASPCSTVHWTPIFPATARPSWSFLRPPWPCPSQASCASLGCSSSSACPRPMCPTTRPFPQLPRRSIKWCPTQHTIRPLFMCQSGRTPKRPPNGQTRQNMPLTCIGSDLCCRPSRCMCARAWEEKRSSE